MKRTVLFGDKVLDMIFMYKSTDENELKVLTDELKEKLENQYLELRDEFVKIINPKYDGWNDEWDAEHGKAPITKDNEKEYYKFMFDKHKKYLQVFNGKHLESGLVLGSDLDEDCDICAYIKNTHIKMNMYLKEREAKK